jgi:hypothetical protein
MKTYIDRGVQAGSFLLQSRTLALDAEFLASSPEDAGYLTSDPRLLSPPFHASPAYSHSPVNGSPILKAEMSHAAKPRRLPQLRPSTNRHSAIRVFSLPEDSNMASEKTEPNTAQRVVSMPEQRPAGGQLADSSVSTEGFEGSMLSGGSFLSGTDTTSGRCFADHDLSVISHTLFSTTSSDSVLIIENNCGLSEAFLSNQSTTKSASPTSEKKMAPGDEGMHVV